MFEAMREAERDPALRDRMGAMLARYRDMRDWRAPVAATGQACGNPRFTFAVR